MSAEHVYFFMHLRNQIKLYHWQTYIYARHIATDEILEKLEKQMDRFVEVYSGKYGRPKLTGKNATITLQNLTEAGAVRLLKSSTKHLQGPIRKHLDPAVDTELITTVDELVIHLNQLLYLFTLH